MLRGKNVVLCVCGGIAAYKAVEVARLVQKAGATVDVAMTEAATQFVTPLTFQALMHRPVALDMFQLLQDMEIGHVSLAERADVIVVAPATANTIAKVANGFADDMVSTTILAATCPVVVAPAMNTRMWENPVTQANVRKLEDRGFILVGPEVGLLAEGSSGAGRLSEPERIAGAARYAVSRRGPLAGRTIVVTAGGTHEPIDPVRFITNRSSGKMGYAVAQAALDLGADVQLVTATTHLEPPFGAQMTEVGAAMEMRQMVQDLAHAADAVIMAAAVADYRVEVPAAQKIKKSGQQWVLTLVQNPDILAELGASRPANVRVLVGFAAETENVLENARLKLRTKGLDIIVANDITGADSGFEVDTNRVTIIDRNGGAESLPLLSKEEVAQHLMERVTQLLLGRSA
ncbi:MAG: bifunctional phosphopantothenoylcysteine decarboxylase/phosphopantothenate--cysteine ligase CoaBC [Anaerolineae bacterium]